MDLKTDIRRLARENEDFRREVITGPHSQVVLMSVEPGSEIGDEVHEDVDQVLVFVDGTGEAVVDGQTSGVESGDMVLVTACRRHNFVNRGDAPLKLYTVYSPPEHPAGTVHHTKEEADAAEEQ